MAEEEKEPRICEPGGRGLFFPLGGDAEHKWNPRIRALLYSMMLVYCFLGVSIVADLFMGAIESITSKKRRVLLKATGRYVTVVVWNDTVANLTLLALGSSAPEILLSGVEIVRNEFFSGKLGPSTIVGSAAFNLLVIIAVCNCAIPSPDRRLIRDAGVFRITALFSLFAYMWLVFIVQVCSKDVIEIWEGVVTFSFFPVLVILSYMADVGYLSRSPKRPRVRNNLGDAGIVKVEVLENGQEGATSMVVPTGSMPQVVSTGSMLTGSMPTGSLPSAGFSEGCMSDTSSIRMVKKLSSRQRAQRRSDAIHMLTGAKRNHGGESSSIPGAHSRLSQPTSARASMANSTRHSVSSRVSVGNDLDDAPFHDNNPLVVKSITFDNDVEAHMRGSNRLGGGSFSRSLHSFPTRSSGESIECGYYSTEVHAMGPRQVSCGGTNTGYESRAGSKHQHHTERQSAAATEVPDISDDTGQVIQNSAGVITFKDDVMEVLGSHEAKEMPVPLYRKNGTRGTVSCRWFTDKLSALPGYDYVDNEGEVVFGPGVSRAEIPIIVLPKRLCERADEFQVVIEGATGGAVFNPNADGGIETNILTIKINNERSPASSRMMHVVEGVLDMDALRLASSAWCTQIREAIFVNGSFEEQRHATVGDWVMHMLVLPWKFFYSLTVPPSVYLHGWLCFLFSLLHIGFLTAVIIDVTELFGCVANIEDSISAITFVALGTSLPDLFASKTAAVQDAWADASIVNVTGSNSVNVFLGIGLPWTMASIRWKHIGQSDKWKQKYPKLIDAWPNGAFVVEARGLSFSVIVFTIAAFIWLIIMTFRRRALGGELGGPLGAKIFTSLLLILLWLFYVTLSIWKAETKSESTGAQVAAVLFAIATLTGVVLVLGLGINLCGSCCIGMVAPVLSENGQSTPTPQVVQQVETPPPPKPFESWGVQPPAAYVPPVGTAGQARHSDPDVSDQQPMDSTRVLNVLRRLRRDQVHVHETVARWNNVLTSLQQAICGDSGVAAEKDLKDEASPATDEGGERQEDDRDNIVSLPAGMGGMKKVVVEEVCEPSSHIYHAASVS